MRQSKIKISTEKQYYTCATIGYERDKDVIVPYRTRFNKEVIGGLTDYIICLKEERDSQLKIIKVNRAGVFSENIKQFYGFKKGEQPEHVYNTLEEMGVYFFELYDCRDGVTPSIYTPENNKTAELLPLD